MSDRSEDARQPEPHEFGPLVRVSTAIVGITLIYAVLILAFSIYSHQRWTTTSSQVRAYLLPVSAVVLLTAILRSGPTIRILTALSIVPLFAILIVADLAFAQPDLAVKRAGWHWLFERRRAAVASELRARGVAAYPFVTAPDFNFEPTLTNGAKSFLPFSGISRVRTVLCHEGDLLVTYLSDEHGFNNPAGLWTSDSIDVALVGDSFVVGMCVSPRDHFASIVRDEIPRTLNVGGSGNGPLIELGVVREYLAAARPSRVLWFFYEGNDMNDLDREKHHRVRSYLDPSFTQRLGGQQRTVDSALVLYTDSLVGIALRGKPLRTRALNLILLRNLRIGLSSRAIPKRVPDFALLREVLSEARRTVHAWGGSLTLVYLPDAETRTDPSARSLSRIHELDVVHSEVTRMARDLDLPLLDIGPVFSKDRHARSTQWTPRTHYSPYGNRLLATAVLEYLRQKDEPTVK